MALGGQIMTQDCEAKVIRPLGMTERLRVRKEQLENDLALVNEALAALEGNEEIARAVDAISKIGHF